MKNRLYNSICSAVAVAVLLIGLTGCSKPAVEETRDAKGSLQFPNTGRLPTAEELAKINKGSQGGPKGPQQAKAPTTPPATTP